MYRGGFRGPDKLEKAFGVDSGARRDSSPSRAKSVAKFKRDVKRTKAPNVSRDVMRGGWRM